MALISTSLDYTDNDYQSLLARARSAAQSVFPEWSDFDERSISNFVLELLAHIGDIAMFNSESMAREAFFTAMSQRRNMVAQSKLIDYELATAKAATATLQGTILSGALSVAMLIEAGREFETDEEDPKTFRNLADTLVPIGATSFQLVVENSRLQSEILTTSVPDGQPIPKGLEVELEVAPYLDNSLIVQAFDGEYTEVQHLIDSGATDRVFSVSVNANDRAVLRFGNDVNGKVPVSPIYVTYATGGGVSGNVDAGSIRVFQTPFTDLSGGAVTVSISNADKANNGEERESLERARQKAPASLRTLTRAVAREDFEIVGELVSGVARTLMMTSNEKAGIQENTGQLVVIPTGGGLPTDALKAQVKDKFGISLTATERALAGSAPAVQYPMTLTFTLDVVDPTYKSIDIQTAVFLNEGETPSTVAARIRVALTDFFKVLNDDGSVNTNINFGGSLRNESGVVDPRLPWSTLHDLIFDVTGVSRLDAGASGLLLNGAVNDVTLNPEEFPILGVVTILNASDGSVL